MAERGTTPSFSVIIAAYQAAPYIAEAIDSVLAQTVAPLEIIVCDDGSTDDIDGAIAPYRDRITFLRQENRGVGAAKTAAARAASGDFISVLDADDVYLPARLEALAEAARARPDLDILNANANVVLDGKTLRRAYDETWAFEVDDQRRGILDRCFVLGHAAMRRDAYVAAGGFDETLRAVADWDLWIRMILNGSRAGMVAEPLSEYRVRRGSVSSHGVTFVSSAAGILRAALERSDLEPHERATAMRTLAAWERQLELTEARVALVRGEPGSRRRLGRIALRRGHSFRTRAKAGLSALAPGTAGRVLGQREAASSLGAAGVRIENRADAAR